MYECILIIGNDGALVGELRDRLHGEGYRVDVADAGTDGLKMAQERLPDLAILDAPSSGSGWLEMCRQLQEMDRGPSVLVLAKAGLASDQVAALKAGADDYVVYPVDPEVLLARIQALLRRCLSFKGQKLQYKGLSLDTASRVATLDGREISLTTTEYELLLLFLRNPERVLTRAVIMDKIWGYDFAGNYNILEVYISYLRAKLEEKGERRLIHTVRGAGYVLREREAAAA